MGQAVFAAIPALLASALSYVGGIFKILLVDVRVDRLRLALSARK